MLYTHRAAQISIFPSTTLCMIYRVQLEAAKAQHQNEIARFQVLKQEQLNLIDKLRVQINGLNEQKQNLQFS